MPTYSYACTMCDHRFDVRQSFSDDPLTDCPECFDGRLRKVIHPVGIAFKGSGFYKTDSKTSGKPTSAPSASESTSETTSESKSESTSASKAESKTESKPASSGTSSSSPTS